MNKRVLMGIHGMSKVFAGCMSRVFTGCYGYSRNVTGIDGMSRVTKMDPMYKQDPNTQIISARAANREKFTKDICVKNLRENKRH